MEKRQRNNKATVSRSPAMIGSADEQQENAERKADEYEYREGDLEACFGCDPDFTGDLTTEEYLQKIRSGNE